MPFPPDQSGLSHRRPEPLSRRLLLLGAPVALAALGSNPWLAPAVFDNALYLEAGRSLAEGRGYTFNGEAVTDWPPGFPLLLAIPRLLGLPGILGGRIVVLACMLGALLLLERLLRREGHPYPALVTGLTGLLPTSFLAGTRLLAEWPFLLGTSASLLLLGGLRSEDRGWWRRGLLAGLAVAATTLVRYPGIVLLVVPASEVLAGLLRKPRSPSHLLPRLRAPVLVCACALLGLAPWFVWLHGARAAQPLVGTYQNLLSLSVEDLARADDGLPPFVAALADRGEDLLDTLSEILIQAENLEDATGLDHGPFPWILMVPGGLLLLGFLARLLGPRRRPGDLFTGAVLTLLLATGWIRERYWIPILPWILAGAAELPSMAVRLSGSLAPTCRRLLVAGTLVLGLGAAAGDAVLLVRGRPHAGHGGLSLLASPSGEAYYRGVWRDLYRHLRWIRREGPPGCLAVDSRYLKYAAALTRREVRAPEEAETAQLALTADPEWSRALKAAGWRCLREGTDFRLWARSGAEARIAPRRHERDGPSVPPKDRRVPGAGQSCHNAIRPQTGPGMDPSLDSDLEALLHQAASLAASFLERQRDPEARVVAHRPPEELAGLLPLDLPLDGRPADEALEDCARVLEHSVLTGHPRFLNQLFGGTDLAGVVGDWIASAANTSMYTYEVAPAMTLLEGALVREACRLFGIGQASGGAGVFTPGGSLANLMAVLMARDRAFPEARRRGLPADPQPVLFATMEAHYSIRRAAGICGLGESAVFPVDSDWEGRMKPSALDAAIRASGWRGWKPFLVVCTAGTTVLGAFDPIKEVAAIAREHQLWLHVDAVWGGSAIFSPRYRPLLAGTEHADSLSWNPHKMLGLPLTCSLLLTAEAESLERSLAVNASYLFHDPPRESADLGQRSLQCGRRVDALKLWLAWRIHGYEGFQRRVDRLFALARAFRDRVVERPAFDLVREPQSCSVCFRYVPPRLRRLWLASGKLAPPRALDRVNRRLRERLRAEGRWFVNFASLNGVACLRLVLSHPDLREEDLDDLLDDLERLGADL